MLIPKVFYGRHRDVTSECRKLIRKIAKGARLDELPELSDTLDPRHVEGLIFVTGPSSGHADRTNFHCFPFALLLIKELMHQRVSRERTSEFSDYMIAHDSSILGFLSVGAAGDNWIPDLSKQQAATLVLNIVERWPDFVSYGERYADSAGWPEPLTRFCDNISWAMMRHGVEKATAERLAARLDFASIAQLARAAL